MTINVVLFVWIISYCRIPSYNYFIGELEQRTKTGITSDLISVKPSINYTYKTYYLSQYGNDNNNGLSEKTPKKNLKSVNALSNCTILLKSGEEFTLNSTDMRFFSVGSNCMVSSYGGMTKPVINGYMDLKLDWTLYLKNIYSASLKDKGFYTGLNKAYDLCNVGHLLVNSEYNGKRVQKFEQLAKEGEYYIEENTCKIYYYTLHDINAFEFKTARNSIGVSFNNVKDSSIQGIEIKGFGRHGISIINSKNITVTNNYVHDIGGCKFNSNSQIRYGNGIELYNNGENITVKGNHIADCFDAGITNQTGSATKQHHIYFKNNIVERCWYCIEVFDGNDTVHADFKDIVYENNVLLESTDITKGYRYGAGKVSGALFRVYCFSGNELLLKNNICFLSQCFVIYCRETAGLAGVTFDGNVYIQKTGGNIFHPSSHKKSENEQLIII